MTNFKDKAEAILTAWTNEVTDILTDGDDSDMDYLLPKAEDKMLDQLTQAHQTALKEELQKLLGRHSAYIDPHNGKRVDDLVHHVLIKERIAELEQQQTGERNE